MVGVGEVAWSLVSDKFSISPSQMVWDLESLSPFAIADLDTALWSEYKQRAGSVKSYMKLELSVE